MFIEEATSCGSSILMEWEFGGVSFCQEGKPEKPEKKHSEQGESNPHVAPRRNLNRTQATFMGGERSYPCAIPLTF